MSPEFRVKMEKARMGHLSLPCLHGSDVKDFKRYGFLEVVKGNGHSFAGDKSREKLNLVSTYKVEQVTNANKKGSKTMDKETVGSIKKL
jgi:hypothetical protein